jgi:tetratricopeptide (TPR) repeat protein
MRQRRHRAPVFWAIACLALAGCASPRGAPPGEPAKTSEADDARTAEAHAHYAQGLIYDLQEKDSLALEEFSKAALADPSNEALVLDLTRRYIQAKESEKALTLLEKAAAVPDASASIYAYLGLVYSRLGKDSQAIAATQTAIKRDPTSLSGYQNLFVIRLQKNQPQEALKVLDQAAKAPDTDAEFLVELGGLYGNLERQQPELKAQAEAAGRAVLDRAVKLDPTNPRLVLKLADNYNALGAATNAAQVYLKLLGKYGELPTLRNDIHARLAEIYLRDRDPSKAREQLEAIVKDDPANGQAFYYLGSMAYEEKKLPEAVDYFQKALRFSDDLEDAYYDLAGAQINLDKPQDALATLERARAKFPGSFNVEFVSGLAYVRAKDFTNAVRSFDAAEQLGRTSDSNRLTGYFYFETAAAHERKGDFDRAEQLFEKSLKLEPDMPEALNYYGYMLADRGVKLDKARGLIEKALKQEPDNAAYLDSLGWVLYKLGKPELGLEQIQKAIAHSEEPDATIYEHLGDIYARLKQDDKAREAWRKSLNLEPNEEIKKKLDQSGGNPKS